MSQSAAIPRISLIWLMVAQVLVIVPHLAYLPVWIMLLWLGCALWRVQIYRMRARYPGQLIKAGLIVATGAGVVLSRGTLVGLDAGVAVLIAAFILKMLEMKSQRDALVVILLGFFSVAAAYLFNDSLLAAVYSILPVAALLAALIGLQQSSLANQPWPTARLAGSLLLQALPIMLLLFVFFPRIGPLWSLPVADNKAQSGLSDSMSPADIADLSRSDALAFRASFEGQTPHRSELYWRALTLDQFDGRRWSQSGYNKFAPASPWQKQGDSLRYSIIMQPSAKPWLFALDVAQSSQEATRQMSDFRLQHRKPIERPLQYQAQSWPEALRDPELSAVNRMHALQLPEAGDPRSRAWAAELQQQFPQPDQLVQQLLQHFNREPFVYTLRPPLLGQNSIDEFLFDSRRGFCAHYAGAMTFILRAAGIPARVVAGYQGGEYNPAGNYVQVRQFDAHAWVEYWQQGRGWVSVDPTFQVAPQRIEQGLEEAIAEEQSFLEGSPFSPLRYRDLGWLNDLRMNWDNLNYGWQRWVLNYQTEQQLVFIQRWLGRIDAPRVAVALVGSAALILSLLALWLFKPWRRERDVSKRLYLNYLALLARHGVDSYPGEGARALAERAAAQLPEQAEAIRAFAGAFEAMRYGAGEHSEQQLRQRLKSLRRALPWVFPRLDRRVSRGGL